MSARRRITAVAMSIVVLIAIPLVVVAAGDFNDVPANNPHVNDIAWLADAGVTRGCNPPTNTSYCPDRPVLRDQMASFLRRLAEGQIVDAATAVDAENAVRAENAVQAENALTLGGFSPEQLVSAHYDGLSGTLNDVSVSGSGVEIFSTNVTAPIDGFFVISGLYNAEWDISSAANSSMRTSSSLRVDGEAYGIAPFVGFEPQGVTNDGKVVAIDAVVPVTAGDHEISLHVRGGGQALLFVHDASITTIFVPFGSDMRTTLRSAAPVDDNQ